MNIKALADNPKLWQTLTGVLTAVLSYFGYVQISEQASHDVDVEVIVPDQTTHSHKDWLPVIKSEIERARKAHSNTYHGGD